MVIGRLQMRMESRELVAGSRWGLWSRSGLGWDGNTMERQGMAGDIAFHDSDRDVARAGTWRNEDKDLKACQDKDEDWEAQDRR
jgi:hypothetical protein